MLSSYSPRVLKEPFNVKFAPCVLNGVKSNKKRIEEIL